MAQIHIPGSSVLQKYLEKFSNCRDGERLCTLAFEFRHTEAFVELSGIIKRTHRSDIWPMIRHYIGRLGSWSKASRFLSTHASCFAHLLQNADARCVPPKSSNLHKTLCVQPNLDEVLMNLFDKVTSVEVKQAREALQGRHGQCDIGEKFAERRTRRQSNRGVHAEIKILDFFSCTSRQFANDHPYIGCSKPPCYCCNLYIQSHPLDVEVRPAHGNSWVKWTAPRRNPSLPSDVILSRMVEQMRRDLISKFSVGLEPSNLISLLESRTGIS